MRIRRSFNRHKNFKSVRNLNIITPELGLQNEGGSAPAPIMLR